MAVAKSSMAKKMSLNKWSNISTLRDFKPLRNNIVKGIKMIDDEVMLVYIWEILQSFNM